jgi:hypothetical protein
MRAATLDNRETFPHESERSVWRRLKPWNILFGKIPSKRSATEPRLSIDEGRDIDVVWLIPPKPQNKEHKWDVCESADLQRSDGEMLNCPRDTLRAEPQDLKPQHAFDEPVGLALVHNFFLTDDFLKFEHAPFDMVLDIHGAQPSICHFRIVTFSVPDVEPAHANVKSVHD